MSEPTEFDLHTAITAREDAEDQEAVQRYAHDPYAAAAALRRAERALEKLTTGARTAVDSDALERFNARVDQARAEMATQTRITIHARGEVSINGSWANNGDHAEVQALADRLASIADDMREREAGE